MRKLLTYIILAGAALAAAACDRKYEIIDTLGVSSHTLELAETPGETHIAVYSTGEWSVALERNVDWASLSKLSGKGLGDFIFSWSANYGTSRSVDILVSRDDISERIRVIQAGYVNNPFIRLGLDKLMLPRQGASFSVPMSTNLSSSLDQFKAKAVYFGASSRPDTLEIGSENPKAWISSCTIEEEKIEFSVKPNTGAARREATLICYMTDAAGVETRASLPIVQTETDPVFTLSSHSGSYYSNGESQLIPASENNIWSLDNVRVSADVPWIKDMAVVEEGLSFTADENLSGEAREATISVSYSSAEGLSAGDSFTLRQAPEKLLSFEDLRGRVPGTIRGSYLIEGFMVSDPSSPNLCSSPQTAQYAFDRSENGRTAYMESIDGSLGICIKFANSDLNNIPRGSKVLVNLNGASLERAINPLRFTLRNLSAGSISIVDDGAEMPVKKLSISQLSDSDIYTYVSLENVEIMRKDGAYTNINEGYSMQDELNPLGNALPRCDVAPLLCSDVEGSYIHMLTNMACPWRRTGNDVDWGSCVAQGSGTLSGVLVSDDVAPVRWGYLGRYQIRPIDLADIDLNGNPFSETICEWNWNGSSMLTADEGSGKLLIYDSATKFTYDYNNPYLPVENSPNGYDKNENRKGMVNGGALCLTQKWWDYTLGEGRYFDISFNALGISGSNMVLGIVWGHGLDAASVGAPSHWKVLYSVNGGSSFTELSSAGILKQRSCVWWSNPSTSQDSTPGYTEHLVKLPEACIGKKEVVVRLQVADNVADIAPPTGENIWRQALGIEKGTIPDKETPVRIGSICIRYN